MTDTATHKPADLEAVVELQASELERLVRDNQRLNNRIDHLIEEVGGLQGRQARGQPERGQRQRDPAPHREADEALCGLAGKAMILPQSRDGGASHALTDIHRMTPADPNALRARFTDVEAQRQPDTAWPDIPAFLRRAETG